MLRPRWNRREAMEVSERLGVKIWNVASRNWSLENSSWHLEDGDTTKVPDAGNGVMIITSQHILEKEISQDLEIAGSWVAVAVDMATNGLIQSMAISGT